MALFCEFFHMTPNEYENLELHQYYALGRLMERRADEQEG